MSVKISNETKTGVFVLVCTYRLPVVEAGRFGLAATLVGIAAFVLGYERHIELLRNAAGRSTTDVRWRLRDALRFFALHAAWVLPAFAALLAFALGWPAHWVALLALIALSEHLSNQGYIAVLLDGSHYPLLAAVAVKNGVLALAVVTGTSAVYAVAAVGPKEGAMVMTEGLLGVAILIYAFVRTLRFM